MSPRELKHFLELLKIKQIDLAKQIPCSRVELSQTINGERVNSRIRSRMAQILKQPVDKLFGPDHDALTSHKRKVEKAGAAA